MADCALDRGRVHSSKVASNTGLVRLPNNRFWVQLEQATSLRSSPAASDRPATHEQLKRARRGAVPGTLGQPCGIQRSYSAHHGLVDFTGATGPTMRFLQAPCLSPLMFKDVCSSNHALVNFTGTTDATMRFLQALCLSPWMWRDSTIHVTPFMGATDATMRSLHALCPSPRICKPSDRVCI